MSATYTHKDIEKSLQDLNEWNLEKDTTHLVKSFSFSSFTTALTFVNDIAVYAEEMNHHPDIELSYGKVTVHLTSHDAGGLTEKDFALAKKIEAVYR